MPAPVTLSGWGRFPRQPTRLVAPRGDEGFAGLLAAGEGLIARGHGRAYGDAAVGRPVTAATRHLDRMIAFDPATGQLVAEAGVTLAEVIAAFLPRGWFPSVTPGTRFVTLGGAIAADVHGKNHHRDGSFGAFVDWLDLMGPDGTVRRCSRGENADLFGWTLGGMGLTGIILRAAIRLRPVETGWIRQETRPAADLDAAIALMEEARPATYSVAWIDCLSQGAALGRSLVLIGEHATGAELTPRERPHPWGPARRSRTVPFDAPPGLLNGWTVGAFNALYWRNGLRAQGTRLVDWESYFYPLDAILGWNRIYGPRGFAQYQCVLPLAESARGLRRLIGAIGAAGAGSFLSVLKRLGAQESRFSFPMEGYTLALDFPVGRRSLALMERLDRIVLDHGGRFYLAKDARMGAATLAASDPRVAHFTAMRAGAGLAAAFRSAQSERLDL
ncbi:FAD-binding protein (plasmid) [Cereibacter azotoformans]|uniref:FAD/FMN-containing dehydrogenase n=1 Tax=Cereibacter azotoformans TaxID=43057 RepID=A0A2T5JSS3_9RHOB|nr:FAD-binding oxidoreductase [Cereibacter azotoformans]PTR12048.1 FAD/FMN-containing dehydrogenase [Cereibacter azotoformans]